MRADRRSLTPRAASVGVGALLLLPVLLVGAGCGVVNGLGGPWPLLATTDDGGTVLPPLDGGVCPDGTHDGGEGRCVPEGMCAAGFFLEQTGRCSGWLNVPAHSPARSLHTLSVLRDGRVLSVGGLVSGVPLAEGPASLLPATAEAWAQTGGSTRARYGHTAELLSGNRVVVVGGYAETDVPAGVAELYRADQDNWVDVGTLVYGRAHHRTVLLSDGTLYALGGIGPNGAALANVERLDAGEFTVLPASMNTGRSSFGAVVTADDTVIVVGGLGGDGLPLSSTESLALGAAGFVLRAPMTDPRAGHTTTLLGDGRVVVIGGRTDGGFDELEAIRTIEVYNPSADTWADLGLLSLPRWGHSASLLDDGRILIAGGFGPDGSPTTSVEILDPSTTAVSEGPPLRAARGNHPAVTLPDGSVLVVQGSLLADDGAAVTSAERYVRGTE